MASYVCSIDQGTSSSRCILFTREGKVASSHQLEHKQHFPKPGLVEHDPQEIWQSVQACVRGAMQKVGASATDIVSIGITNQRETTCMWNKRTGQPYHNAIVWNDMRTSEICGRFIKASTLGQDRWRKVTGLPIATYFSFSKIVYLLESIPELRRDAANGDALFGTIDTWLIWKLTGGMVHATDVTNASRTGLMGLHSLQWEDDILRVVDVPRTLLPTILSSSEVYGHVSASSRSMGNTGLDELKGVPVSGVLGDQHAALFGQACFDVGQAKCTYGTGAFLLMNTGSAVVPSKNGLLTTLAYKLGKDQPPVYALEGAVAYSGSLIQWLRDNLQILPSADQSETLAAPDNGGVYFVPAFAGLYAPYWRDDARGVIAGLTAFHTKHHIIRAALEATAFQTTEVLTAMHIDSKVKLQNLQVDGGMTSNDTLMQFQSDLVNVPLMRPMIAETTALGVAFVAGLSVGFWKLDELKAIWKKEKSWKPSINEAKRRDLMLHWHKALLRSLRWVDTGKGGAETDEEVLKLIRGGNKESFFSGSLWSYAVVASTAAAAISSLIALRLHHRA